ncbi:MAG: hypothetical protein R3A45_04560 [Bdellovibrionota bacterium]
MTLTQESMYYDQVLNVDDQMAKKWSKKKPKYSITIKYLDSNNQKVRIPISRAMELIVQEGQ